MYAKKTSMSLLRICVYAQIVQRWKILLSKSRIGPSAHVPKNFHVSIKDLRIYAQTIQRWKTLLSKIHKVVKELF